MRKSIKIITLLLALVMLIASFASCEILEDMLNPEDDVEEPENPGGSTDCDHFWMQGVCILCDAKCTHQWEHAICSLCDCYCKHPSASAGGECDTCGKKMVAAEFTITYTVPDTDEKQLIRTEKCNTAMYLDECFTHGFTYLAYMFRYGIFDIYVDGVKTADGSMLIDKDCTIEVKLKSDVIRVSSTVVDRFGKSHSQRIYLPKSGLSLDTTCLIASSTSTKFEELLKTAAITLDGEKITDGSYKIVEDCDLMISFASSTPTPGGTYPNDMAITVTLNLADTGEKFEKAFFKGDHVYISEVIKQMAGMDFAQMLKDGEITANGITIREDYRIGEDTDIVFSKTPEGMIEVSFTGIPDMGSGAHVNYSALFEAGVTFEKAVNDMLGMSYEEYSEKYFNTRIAQGPHTEWVAIYPDTVFNNSVAITANKYKEHEITDKVYLNVQLDFDGLESQRLELDYGTTLSEALAPLGLNFNELLKDNTVEMFFNVYRILHDVKIKYDSIIYGYKICAEHEWVNRQCTVCGATCNFTYYDEPSCPSCGSEHPSERPEGEIVKVHIYAFDADGKEYESCIKEIPSGSSVADALKLLGWDNIEELLNNGTLTVNEEEVTLDNIIKLYGDEKIVYHQTKT